MQKHRDGTEPASLEERDSPPGLLLVAHGAGNSLRRMRQAVAAGVAFVEADLWLEGSRFVARHGRRLGSLRLLYDKWHVRPYLRPFTLDTILTADPPGLFLDVRGGRDDVLRPLVEALREAGALERSVLTSQDWLLLDKAREHEPRLRLSYSVGHRGHLGPLV
ncbi:MAG TPA: hypothetical protein VJ256_01590 [Dehalococcoidia bacterium]|nr:hypothetical protein [Dehalococcoidia bacterium]